MPSITIRWGSNLIEEKERPVCTAEFKTQAELVAYLEGVDDSSGWMDYEVVEEEDDLWDNEPPIAEDLSNTPITP